ncbi:ATP-binding protein [Calothrix sp. NIES-2098]|uniref:ATP-binding protein n=1 Tax=Calothrix sp. NIES-2098 TaxID=1954171 RepID=UPI000B6141D5|nr:AAA ATPase [Calothrix sp. NIES-2098]
MFSGFPRELLQQSVAARLDYFRSYTVAHPKLKEANEALIRAIREPADTLLIFLYGPSGVGKTTLRLRVEKTLIKEALSNLEIDRGHIPVVGIEAGSPESRSFNWKEYYTQALVTLEEPLIDHKIDYGVRGIMRNSEGQLRIHDRIVAPALRRALEQALSHRRPRIFFIDEAQHLAKIASGNKLQYQLDCIKSLASMTKTLHGLLGTYELLVFRNLSAQLSRRSVDIHFQRYLGNCQEDIRAFKSVIFTFQSHMPLEEPPDLVAHWDYCYERTLGCVGILKHWFTVALRDALDEQATTLTLKHLERRALLVAQCQKMLQEIKEGEKLLTENDADRNQLRTESGLDRELNPSKSVQSAISNKAQEPIPKTPRKGSVGKRKPKRDPIGVENHDK